MTVVHSATESKTLHSIYSPSLSSVSCCIVLRVSFYGSMDSLSAPEGIVRHPRGGLN